MTDFNNVGKRFRVMMTFTVILIVSRTIVSADASGISAFDLSSDGTFYVTGHSDQSVRVWETITGEQIAEYTALYPVDISEPDNIQAVAISPNNQKVALSYGGTDDSGAVRVINVNSGEVLLSLSAGAFAEAIDWNFDGSQLAALTSYGMGTFKSSYLNVWDEEGALLLEERLIGQSTLAVAWSPDGKMLANSSGNEVSVWDTLKWEIVQTVGDHEPGVVTDLAWNPDGRHLAITGSDSKVSVWDVTTGKQTLSLAKNTSDRGIHLVVWTDDGTQIATSVSSKIEHCTIAEGKCVPVLDGDENIRGLAWKPDGNLLYSDGSIHTLLLEEN